jgi:hypothetical protein
MIRDSSPERRRHLTSNRYLKMNVDLATYRRQSPIPRAVDGV